MRAALHDLAAVEHDDLVGAHHSAKALRDHEGRAALHQLVQRLQNEVLGLRVHTRSRVVKDQDTRVEQQRPRDRDTLLLAARERYATLADPFVVAGGQTHDEVVDARRLRGSLDFFLGGVGASVGDVVANRADEQEHVLLHDADRLAQ